MKFFIFINIIGTVFVANALPSQRIFGGETAEDGEFPYQVSLRYLDPSQHQCGGSIISKRYILTAAHCVLGDKPRAFTVVVGTNSVKEGGDFYEIEQIISHDFGSATGFFNDIALMRTAKDIVFNDKVQPIGLPTKDIEEHGYPVVVTGWGYVGIYELPTLLQKLNLQIHDQSKCQSTWPVDEGQICTLTKVGEGICNGDSGGPLVADGVQVGIVSYSNPCGRGDPDVFTRVYYYVDWLKEHMEE